MPEPQSDWLNWEPKRPNQATSETSENSFECFDGCPTRGFPARFASSEDFGVAMSFAIEFLTSICPEDLLERLDWTLRKEKQHLDRLPLTSIEEIESWRNGWRILFAELRIDSVNLISPGRKP